MSKAPLIHRTHHLASELGPNIRTNAIVPGVVKTLFVRLLRELASVRPRRDIRWIGGLCPTTTRGLVDHRRHAQGSTVDSRATHRAGT